MKILSNEKIKIILSTKLNLRIDLTRLNDVSDKVMRCSTSALRI